MNRPRLQRIGNSTTMSVGTGMVVLDVVVNGKQYDSYQLQAGGSCGNVLTILSYLGWQSYPIARLGQDAPGEMIRDDMTRFGVHTEFLRQDPTGSTPAIIETIRGGGPGSRTHSYSLHCPHCGSFLPRHRPLKKESANQVLAQLPSTAVFYFDRSSPASVLLARHYRNAGALIVFEPSSMRDEPLLRKATGMAHILKYSHERLSGLAEALGNIVVPLEIETLGHDGLRYRRRSKAKRIPQWQYMPAYDVSSPIDEAGSGDWCTAGIVHTLGKHGAASFWRTRDTGLERALQLGQALAAINCGFPSARGAMYRLSMEEMGRAVRDVVDGQEIKSEPEVPNTEAIRQILQSVCIHCNT